MKMLHEINNLMSRGRVFQSFGAAYVKERSPRVTLDNFLGQLRSQLSFQADRFQLNLYYSGYNSLCNTLP